MPRKNSSILIFETAQRCLVLGNGDFEITQVAEEAGVSAGLAYRYYKSKGELVSAIVTDFYDRYNAIVNRVYAEDWSWGRREFDRLQNIVSFLYADPLAALILGPMSLTPEVVASANQCVEETNRLAILNIRNGIKTGAIPKTLNPEIAGVGVINACQQVVVHALKSDIQPSEKVLVSQLWRFICGAVDLAEEERAYGNNKRRRVRQAAK